MRLESIGEPQSEFESVLAATELALGHEREVTQTIYGLYDRALQASDYASYVLLEWFVSEQVEEEKTLEELGEHLKKIGDDGTGLIALDKRLGQRTAGKPQTPASAQ